MSETKREKVTNVFLVIVLLVVIPVIICMSNWKYIFGFGLVYLCLLCSLFLPIEAENFLQTVCALIYAVTIVIWIKTLIINFDIDVFRQKSISFLENIGCTDFGEWLQWLCKKNDELAKKLNL